MWKTAFALPHMPHDIEDARQQSRSARAQRCYSASVGRECNSITPSHTRTGIAREKITSERRREFGFFSGLRARFHVRIMLARFDPRF
jgi:hypothetical protein